MSVDAGNYDLQNIEYQRLLGLPAAKSHQDN